MRSSSAVDHVCSSDASRSGHTVLSVLLPAQGGRCSVQNVSTKLRNKCVSFDLNSSTHTPQTDCHDLPRSLQTRAGLIFSLQLILDRAQILEVLG